jgi:cytochrome c553
MRAGRNLGPLLGGLLLFAGTACGARAQTTPSNDIPEKAVVCTTCHGTDGVPISKDIPVIWGQHAGYIFLDLRDFQTGARANALMAAIVRSLSRSDMLALAEYFANKPWPNLGQGSAPDEIAAHAQAVAGSGQCTQCHLSGFLGDSTNPRLAGQRTDYLRKTMQDFHNGTRGNNPWMSALLKTFSDDDIDAMARYLGGL